MIKITHCGTIYECETAVKCENDGYIKLYDANGAEIAAFYDIADFAEFEIEGEYTEPGNCALPIPVACYVIGGRTIAADAWTLGEDSKYYYTIENSLISANVATCNIVLFFASGTDFEYTATQEAGKIVLCVTSAPTAGIVIDSIQISRA